MYLKIILVNSITYILVGILLQAISILFQVLLIRTRKEEWDSIQKHQGEDIDRVLSKRQLLKTIAVVLIAIAIFIQAYGIWLNQFDNLESLKPIWEEISKIQEEISEIKTKLGN